MMQLSHLGFLGGGDDKIQPAPSDSTRSITQQPMGGKPQFGGSARRNGSMGPEATAPLTLCRAVDGQADEGTVRAKISKQS